MPYKDRADIYISFTRIEKLGINPQSEYSTPLGIYAYPLREIWNDILNNTIPFAGSNPQVQVIRVAHPKLQELSEYSEGQFNDDVKKMEKIAEDFNLTSDFNRFKLEAVLGAHKTRNESAGIFWNLSRILSYEITKSKYKRNTTTLKEATMWNKILRTLGYIGFTDKSGMGIIHPNEPTQAVFLSKEHIQHIDQIKNKRYALSDVAIIKAVGDFLKTLTYNFGNFYSFVDELLIFLEIKMKKGNLEQNKDFIQQIIDKNINHIINIVNNNINMKYYELFQELNYIMKENTSAVLGQPIINHPTFKKFIRDKYIEGVESETTDKNKEYAIEDWNGSYLVKKRSWEKIK